MHWISNIQVPSRQEIIDSFIQHGYIEMGSPLPVYEAGRVIQDFREVIQRITPEQLLSTYAMYDEWQDIDIGFVDRSQKDGFDEKYYFHYHPHIHTQDTFRNHESYQVFLQSLWVIYEKMDIIVQKVFDTLAADDENIRALLYPHGGLYKTNSNTRVLQYRVGEHNPTHLAKAHTDRGFLTFALYETDPWLRLYDALGNPHDSDYVSGKMKLFPGDLWAPVMKTSPELPGTLHDVINMDTNNERASIVHFTNLAWAYSKSK